MDTPPVITFLPLPASPRFPALLTPQPARAALIGIEAWRLSFRSLNLSRGAGQVLPAQQEKGADKLEAASQRGGEEGAVTIKQLYLPGCIRLPVTSSPQVVIRVRATEMVKDQQPEEEEGLEQCAGLWACIFFLLLLRQRPVL